MRFGNLLETIDPKLWTCSGKLPDVSLTGLTLSSKDVQPGNLFIAIKGTSHNGEDFIPDAIKAGAMAILCSKEGSTKYAPLYPHICFLETSNIRHIVPLLAGRFYQRHPKVIVGITGTNGKTSTAEFTRQLWEKLGHKSASLGTLGIRSSYFEAPKYLTTPDSIYLHKMLGEMAGHGITHLAMETSSHGLDQHRVDGVPFASAAFTNLSRDHLEYHHTMENYLKAKARLFEELLPLSQTAVLNADIPEFDYLKKCGRPLLTYGKNATDIKLVRLIPQKTGQELHLQIFGTSYKVFLPLLGEFQAYNSLCALGLILATDPTSQEKSVSALESLTGVPGRIELAGTLPNGAVAYVDYAHASGGIETLLKSLRPHSKGAIWIIMGGGGGRDPSTRGPMGKAAHDFADHVIITDDNPRFEDPAHIRAQIKTECPKAQEIGDRREAIATALHKLRPDDILVVTGKGPEDGQIIQGITYPFLDKQVIQSLIKEMIP